MRRLLLTLTALLLTTSAFLASPAHAAWVWPVGGEVITPYRNGDDPYASGQHRGIDIAAPVGTAVRAAAAGDVRFAGTAGSSGLTIGIRTADGYDTSYLHLSSLAVRAGTRVAAGERIGAVGTTGTRSATAPHLHFGVRDAGTRYAYRDPLAFLPPPPVPVPAPNPPAAAPAPVPAPLAPSAAPAPVPAPRSAPAPGSRPAPTGLPGRAPREAPRTRLVPVGPPQPLLAPRTAPRALSAPPAADPAHRAAAGLARVPGSHRVAAGTHRAEAAEPSAPGATKRGQPATTRRSPVAVGQPAATALRPRAGRDARPGRDLGWALACAGLLLAAGILGVTDSRRSVPSRARARLAGALRPLAGRR